MISDCTAVISCVVVLTELLNYTKYREYRQSELANFIYRLQHGRIKMSNFLGKRIDSLSELNRNALKCSTPIDQNLELTRLP